MNTASQELSLDPYDAHQVAHLCGPCQEHLRYFEKRFDLTIQHRGPRFFLTGDPACVHLAAIALVKIYRDIQRGEVFSLPQINLAVEKYTMIEDSVAVVEKVSVSLKTPHVLVRPNNAHQRTYIEQIRALDVNFGLGPAGTGKTYLAVAAAVSALEAGEIERIVLVRPIVETGEKLGFLPGDLAEKTAPYLQPLYDALFEMLGAEKTQKLIELGVIQVVPLAYMRGRTLNNAFVILDEGQNTTKEQMQMFLTRIGFGSKVVVTGDATQIDLKAGITSGLKDALAILQGVAGIGITQFDAQDVLRHPMVKRIVKAYEAASHDKAAPLFAVGDASLSQV